MPALSRVMRWTITSRKTGLSQKRINAGTHWLVESNWQDSDSWKSYFTLPQIFWNVKAIILPVGLFAAEMHGPQKGMEEGVPLSSARPRRSKPGSDQYHHSKYLFECIFWISSTGYHPTCPSQKARLPPPLCKLPWLGKSLAS